MEVAPAARNEPAAASVSIAGNRKMFMRGVAVGVMVCGMLTAWSVPSFAQHKHGADENVRAVQGTVSDGNDKTVDGAVVQLKNTRTLQIRSFVTREQGGYFFHGLSPDVDYELKADYQGSSSGTKTLSSFDNRKQAIINLKLK